MRLVGERYGLDPGASSGALVARQTHLVGVLALVGLMNLFSATMDIAIDGLAVDLLDEPELGTGNITQVVGYKFGTLTSGGLLVWATAGTGWSGLFVAIGALTLTVCAATALFPETRIVAARRAPAVIDAGAYRTVEAPEALPPDLRRIVRALLDSMRVPGMGALLAVIVGRSAKELEGLAVLRLCGEALQAVAPHDRHANGDPRARHDARGAPEAIDRRRRSAPSRHPPHIVPCRNGIQGHRSTARANASLEG